MKLFEIDIPDEILMRHFVEFDVPISAFNFHAYSCPNEDNSYSFGISYLAEVGKEIKTVKFQFADIGHEIKDGAIFIGVFMKYGVHVFLIP